MRFKKYLTPEHICFALLGLIFAGFFFIPKSPHRVLFYILIAATLWAYKDIFCVKAIIARARHHIWVTLFFGYCVLTSFIFALGSLEETFNVVKKAIFISAFIIILISLLRSEKEWSRLFFCYALAAVIIGLGLCLYYFGFLNGERLWGIGRGVNPNVGGLLYGLAGVIIYCHHGRWGFGTYHIPLVIFGLCVCFLVVLATQSRGTMIALGITSFIILVLQRRYYFIGLGIIAAALGVFILIFSGADIYHMIERADNGRFDIWRQAFMLALQNPVAGIGYGTETSFTTDLGTWRSTHNIYLGMFVYHGIIGLALFLTFWVSTFKKIYQKDDLTVAAIMIYAGIFGLFEFHTLFTNLNPEWLVFWLPVAYSIYLKNLPRIQTPPSSHE